MPFRRSLTRLRVVRRLKIALSLKPDSQLPLPRSWSRWHCRPALFQWVLGQGTHNANAHLVLAATWPHSPASAFRCGGQLLHLTASVSQRTARRLHLITMRYILHPHRRTERVDAGPNLWRTPKLALDAQILSSFQHFQISFDISLKHNTNILDFDPRTDSCDQQTTRFFCDAAA